MEHSFYPIVRVNAYGIPSNVAGYFLSSCQRHSQEQWILSIETEQRTIAQRSKTK